MVYHAHPLLSFSTITKLGKKNNTSIVPFVLPRLPFFAVFGGGFACLLVFTLILWLVMSAVGLGEKPVEEETTLKAPKCEMLKNDGTTSTYRVTNLDTRPLSVKVVPSLGGEASKETAVLSPMGSEAATFEFCVNNKFDKTKNDKIVFTCIRPQDMKFEDSFNNGNEKKESELPTETEENGYDDTALKSIITHPTLTILGPYLKETSGVYELYNRNNYRVAYRCKITNSAFKIENDFDDGFLEAFETSNITVIRGPCLLGIPPTGTVVMIVESVDCEEDDYNWEHTSGAGQRQTVPISLTTDPMMLRDELFGEWQKESDLLKFDKQRRNHVSDIYSDLSWRQLNCGRYKRIHDSLVKMMQDTSIIDSTMLRIVGRMRLLYDVPADSYQVQETLPILSEHEQTQAHKSLRSTYDALQVETYKFEYMPFDDESFVAARETWQEMYTPCVPNWAAYLHMRLTPVQQAECDPSETESTKTAHRMFVAVLSWIGHDSTCCNCHAPSRFA